MSYAGGKGASGALHNIINRIPPTRTLISLFDRAREAFKKRKTTILNKFGKLNTIEKNAVLEILKEKS